jgi:hypothetical protein
MTTQVTIKNHGPQRITLKIIEHLEDSNNPVVVQKITIDSDSEETRYIWGTRDFIIEEVEDDES